MEEDYREVKKCFNEILEDAQVMCSHAHTYHCGEFKSVATTEYGFKLILPLALCH